MKTILIPVDFSPQSYHAACFGLELAVKLGMSLSLLHIATPLRLAPAMSAPVGGSGLSKSCLYAELTTEFQVFEGELKEYQREEGLEGVEISSRIVAGQPTDSILEIARTEKPAFVVMGTVVMSGPGASLSRYVASYVAQEITRPLWILPGAVRLHSLRNFTYFAELVGKEVGCIDQAVDLGERLRAKLSVKPLPSGDEEDFLEAQSVTEIFEFSYVNKRVTFRNLMHETMGEGMEAHIRMHGPDAVVLSHRKRGMIEKFFHRSTVGQLPLTSRRPLLIVQKRA